METRWIMCISVMRGFPTHFFPFARLGVSFSNPLFKQDGWMREHQSASRLRGTRHREGYLYRSIQREEERESRAEFIATTLQCSLEEANAFLDHNPRILSTGRKKFDTFIHLFQENNISTNEIFAHPDIFRRNYDTIRIRFQQLKDELDMKPVKLSLVNTGLPLYSKRFAEHLKEKRAKEVYSDKPTMLMSHIGCSRQEAIVLINDKNVLRDSKLSTLRQKLELLVTQGVPTQMILEKSWILTVPLEQLERRSKCLRKEGILYTTCPKSYFFLLKCPEDSFARNLEKWIEEREVLGDLKSRQQFLQRQLHCDDRQIATMLKAYPLLLSVGAAKLNSTLIFLQKDCSLTSREIIANSLLFKFSTDTLKDRHDELKTLGCEVVTAKLLCSDSRVYCKVVDQLKHQLV